MFAVWPHILVFALFFLITSVARNISCLYITCRYNMLFHDILFTRLQILKYEVWSLKFTCYFSFIKAAINIPHLDFNEDEKLITVLSSSMTTWIELPQSRIHAFIHLCKQNNGLHIIFSKDYSLQPILSETMPQRYKFLQYTFWPNRWQKTQVFDRDQWVASV